MADVRLQYQAYEEYKPSGVEWIGEIPFHWNVLKFKFLGKAIIGLTYSPEDLCDPEEGTLVLRASNLHMGKFKYGIDENVYVRGSIPDKLKIRTNDILICSRNGSRDLIGKCALAAENDVGNSFGAFTTVFRSPRNSYLFQILNSDIFRRLSGSFLSSTINQLTTGNLNSIQVPIPSEREQNAIATFLDKKTSQIDQAIGIKEKLIELLKERKQILIQNAVTRGLKLDVPMKDSGADWIGEIPAHWSVLKNRALFDQRIEPGKEDLPLLSVSIHTGVSSEELSDEENIRGKIKIADKEKYNLVEPNDIAFNMMRAWQGGIGAVKVRGMVSPAYIIAKPNEKIFSPYFECLYRCSNFIQQMNRYSKGITDFRKRLYWDEFKQLITLVPPYEEQIAIVEALDSLTSKVEKAMKLQSDQIDKLKEYKATLINSAVTGKIKVV
ncbi:restriction endonuclease subunit S [Terasakiella pusilla]|uniref:restriction endonuclease subunit S n=1 Tax=Terasakiella pusilla TaxID=64973 RepID=UPI003AA7E5B9